MGFSGAFGLVSIAFILGMTRVRDCRPGPSLRNCLAESVCWRAVRGLASDIRGNDDVAPIHEKAMPVILTTPTEFERLLEADTVDALALQRPLPDEG